MSKPTSLIIAAIDRSVDSTPRPPIWLRSLVGAALAVPCVIGLVMAMGVKPTAPLVAKSDQFASLQYGNDGEFTVAATAADDRSDGSFNLPKSIAAGSKRGKGDSSSPVTSRAADATVASAPTGLVPNQTSSEQTIDDIFGINEPEPATVAKVPTPTAPPEPAAPIGGLAGLDNPGNPAQPNAAKPSTAGSDPAKATGSIPPDDIDPEGVPVPAGVAETAAVVKVPSDLLGVPAPEAHRPPMGPDDVPAPSSTKSERVTDLRQLMRDTEAEVAAELDEKFPMYKTDDVVTLKFTNGQVLNGKIIYLQEGYMAMDSNGGRPKILYTRLHPVTRIRCDQEFRDQQVDTETEKRVLDALK